MEQIKLNFPIKDFKWNVNVSQMFGVSSDYYQRNFDALGHQGLDIVVRDEKMGYGAKIYSVHKKKALCTKISIDTTIRTHGNGVYLLEELDDGRKLESLYWHISEPTITVGEWVEPQQTLFNFDKTIALMGNTGQVFPRPTREFPYFGTHLHLALKLYNSDGSLQWNDYNGFIDPTPYLYNTGDKLPVRFNRDLSSGWITNSFGDDVSWLQTCLKIEGFASDYEPVSIYGSKTRRDVSLLQKKYSIEPSSGICGLKTRAFLNEKYAA